MTGDSRFFKKASPYFNTTNGVFDSDAMFENEEFGSSLKTLAKVAVNLFNYNEKVTPVELVVALEDEHLKLALNAIVFRRYGLNGGYEAPEEKIYP